jgi:DNA-binding GntR family transcriptional regulator
MYLEKSAKASRRRLQAGRSGAEFRDEPPAARRSSRNLRDTVAVALRESIMAGEYAPGSPLGEVELAERFGVSRGPVREALIQLEREHLVRSFPNRGSFVIALAEHEFDERLMLRSVLEPIALEHARQRARPADITAIRRRLRDLERTAARRDQCAYVGKDYEFHVAIWELSGQMVLRDTLMQISAPIFVFEALVEDRYRDAGYNIEEDARAHRIIVEYLEHKTDLDAGECLRPVLDLAMTEEKPIVLDKVQSRKGRIPRNRRVKVSS